MSASFLKKITQNTHQIDLDQSVVGDLRHPQSYTERERPRLNKSFTEWLLSPSLYPSDERILSSRVVARRSSEFKGNFYTLETSRATYTFFCPINGVLRLSWPRLKALWSEFSRRYPGRIQGVRFLRTVGDLPIWLDNKPTELRVNTPIKQLCEIACLVEKRVVNRVSLKQISEHGFFRDEVLGLAELVDSQQTAILNYRYNPKPEPIVCNAPIELVPYELLLKDITRGIKFEPSTISCDDIELLTYEDGASAWGIKTESSREELVCLLREAFGSAFIEELTRNTKKKISHLGACLSSYRSNDAIEEGRRLRWAVRDLIVGYNLPSMALVLTGPDVELSSELGGMFETTVISEYKDNEIGGLAGTYGPVMVIHLEDPGYAPRAIYQLKSHGIKVLTVQNKQDSYAGIIQISPKLSLPDQVIEVLRELSNTLTTRQKVNGHCG